MDHVIFRNLNGFRREFFDIVVQEITHMIKPQLHKDLINESKLWSFQNFVPAPDLNSIKIDTNVLSFFIALSKDYKMTFSIKLDGSDFRVGALIPAVFLGIDTEVERTFEVHRLFDRHESFFRLCSLFGDGRLANVKLLPTQHVLVDWVFTEDVAGERLFRAMGNEGLKSVLFDALLYKVGHLYTTVMDFIMTATKNNLFYVDNVLYYEEAQVQGSVIIDVPVEHEVGFRTRFAKSGFKIRTEVRIEDEIIEISAATPNRFPPERVAECLREVGLQAEVQKGPTACGDVIVIKRLI